MSVVLNWIERAAESNQTSPFFTSDLFSMLLFVGFWLVIIAPQFSVLLSPVALGWNWVEIDSIRGLFCVCMQTGTFFKIKGFKISINGHHAKAFQPAADFEKYSFTHSDINLLVCFVSVCLSFRSQTGGLIFFFGISTHVVGREQNAWLNQLWQIFQVSKPQSSPRPRYYHHCGWLLIWCYFYEMLC